MEDFWNTKPAFPPLHETVSKHISLIRWQQIDQFFHMSTPLYPDDKVKGSTFEKLEPLSEHLRIQFKKCWTIEITLQ